MRVIELKFPKKSDTDTSSLDSEIIAVAAIHLRMLENMLQEGSVYTPHLSEALDDISKTYKDYSQQIRRLSIKQL